MANVPNIAGTADGQATANVAEFLMPSLGADMEAGTLVAWRVRPGEPVKRADIIAVVETAKGAIEVEVFQSGVVERLLVGPGVRVPIGTPLALIRTEARPVPSPSVAPPAALPKVPTPAVTEARVPGPERIVPPPAVPPSGGVPAAPRHVRASPLARRLAAELGVDLTTVHGTGPGGVVERADVERAAAAAARGAAPPAIERVAAMRAAIGAAMARSKREIPH